MCGNCISYRDERVTDFVFAERISAQKDCLEGELLCRPCSGQATCAPGQAECVLHPGGWIVLDFGRELHGGIDVVTGWMGVIERDVLVSFGESVMETFSHPAHGHTVQEFRLRLSSSATISCGELGFRFVKLENVEKDPLALRGVRGRFMHRELVRKAEFHCSEPLLENIWQTSAYTLELCMQNFVWDGIKRDRLVWMGDLYPEVITAATVFGKASAIEKSLDFLRNETPLPEMMNNNTAYSMWWILAHRAWFRYFGDLAYLGQQKEYLLGLLETFAGMVDEKGLFRQTKGYLLIDWATGVGEVRQDILRKGLHGLLCITFEAGADLCCVLGEEKMADRCRQLAAVLRRRPAEWVASTAGNAFQVLAGMGTAEDLYRQRFEKELPAGLSTFLGCFPLDVCAAAGHRAHALDILRQYWGGMLQAGATTFWEHFDTAWLIGGGRIDEFVPPGSRDIHGENGEGCFESYRNSLCHGWSSMPAEWLIRQICGVSFQNARTIRFAPDLCGLQEASCKLDTPAGTIRVQLTEKEQIIEAPPEITILREPAAGNVLPDFAGGSL